MRSYPWLALAGLLAVPSAAEAFCGFYVSGADGSLYSDATMVVMLREGTRTVLSMQNRYQGPPEDFAMVVPVPVVLQEENVRTLPREIFDKIDRLAAPRLVEYWETDPCFVAPPIRYAMAAAEGAPPPPGAVPEAEGVTVEAEFAVGEYDIVILSATDSSGLERWLHRERYNIPDGAGAVLRPYVEAGTKFFVAKVDVERVTMDDGRALLSPLRVHYDSDEFSLPVRLGLLNSAGEQDLIVHVLSRGQRYEVANYDNAFIPTNLRMTDAVRHEFGAVYEQLFAETVSRNRRTVVTEYSWDASSCDPCPGPTLDAQDLLTLGADTLPGQPAWGYVLTRLHYRYSADDLGEDLVFRAAAPVVGGRGTPDAEGRFEEQGASPGPVNNFQGRYAILHPWEGSVTCDEPVRGRWGGPPEGGTSPTVGAGSRLRGAPPPSAAPRPLSAFLAQAVPELGVAQVGVAPAPAPPAPSAAATPPAAGGSAGCAGCGVAGRGGVGGGPCAMVLVVAALVMRRRG